MMKRTGRALAVSLLLVWGMCLMTPIVPSHAGRGRDLVRPRLSRQADDQRTGLRYVRPDTTACTCTRSARG